MTSDLVEHYSTTAEHERLFRTPHGRLEFLRTQELIRRVLTSRARVLDVGGGTGVHARWPAADGHSVHLVDPVPGHIAAAAALHGVTAELGDTRRLPTATDSADAVLMLGPLYHLTHPDDRAAALHEAARVLRPATGAGPADHRNQRASPGRRPNSGPRTGRRSTATLHPHNAEYFGRRDIG